jgi:hypothetical protein
LALVVLVEPQELLVDLETRAQMAVRQVLVLICHLMVRVAVGEGQIIVLLVDLAAVLQVLELLEVHLHSKKVVFLVLPILAILQTI